MTTALVRMKDVELWEQEFALRVKFPLMFMVMGLAFRASGVAFAEATVALERFGEACRKLPKMRLPLWTRVRIWLKTGEWLPEYC